MRNNLLVSLTISLCVFVLPMPGSCEDLATPQSQQADGANPAASAASDAEQNAAAATPSASSNASVKPTAPAVTPAAASTTSATTPTAAAAQAGSVGPGALQKERQQLLQSIKTAEKNGVGISAYMAAFSGVEAAAKSGESAELLRPKIERISASLSSQQKSSYKNAAASGTDQNSPSYRMGHAMGYAIGREMAKRILQGR